MLKRFFLNLKGLFDANAVSITKKEYGSAVENGSIDSKIFGINV